MHLSPVTWRERAFPLLSVRSNPFSLLWLCLSQEPSLNPTRPCHYTFLCSGGQSCPKGRDFVRTTPNIWPGVQCLWHQPPGFPLVWAWGRGREAGWADLDTQASLELEVTLSPKLPPCAGAQPETSRKARMGWDHLGRTPKYLSQTLLKSQPIP